MSRGWRRGTEAGVAEAGQRPVGSIDLVALVARREQPRATRDRLGVRVMLDRSHLSGQFAGADDVDSRMAQQEDIGRFHEDSGEVSLDPFDLPGLGLPVLVQRPQIVLGEQGRVARQAAFEILTDLAVFGVVISDVRMARELS